MEYDGGELPNYSGLTGPVGVAADGEISCFSDGAGQEKGWSMYADITTPAPILPPTPSSTSLIVVSYGECNVVDDWVHSPNIPQISGQIWRVTFVSEAIARFLWTFSAQRSRCSTFFGLGTRTLNRLAPKHCCNVQLLFVLVFRLQHKPQGVAVVC